MKKPLIALLLWLGSSLVGATDVWATDLQVRAAEITGYGIFEARNEGTQRGFRSNAPAADGVTSVRFTEFTNDIPARLGTNFGFQYVINSTPRGATMHVTNVIRFPGEGLQQPNGRTWKESREDAPIKIGQRQFYGYGFDEAWEVVPGEWVFEVWHKDARIIRKTFNVVAVED